MAPAILVARVEEGDVAAILGRQVDRPVGDFGADALGKFDEDMFFRRVLDLVDRIEAQAVKAIFLQPVEGAFHDVAAHRIDIIGDAGTPGRHAVLVEEIGRQPRQVVSFRAEMIEHQIENDGYAMAMGGIDEGLEILRPAIG